MTLTEYLQTAVTELREAAPKQQVFDISVAHAALALHVETMLRIYRYTPDSPSLRSVAQLVAAITGREMPA